MVGRTRISSDSLQGMTDEEHTPRSIASSDSFEAANLGQEAYSHYSTSDLENKIKITNSIYAMKRSDNSEDVELAKQFKRSFTSENEYLKKYASSLTHPYAPKDPTLTPFIKTILDGHPFFARRMFDLIVKEKGDSAVPELARQLFSRWNDTKSGMQELDRNNITGIIDGCIPELSGPFRDLFYVKPKKS